MILFSVLFLAGLTLPKLYERLPSEVKNTWKKKYDVHHGEAGVLMWLGGALAMNPGLSAFGAGLVIDDWKDKSDWFKPKLPDTD